jgi:hypothetical protein
MQMVCGEGMCHVSPLRGLYVTPYATHLSRGGLQHAVATATPVNSADLWFHPSAPDALRLTGGSYRKFQPVLRPYIP